MVKDSVHFCNTIAVHVKFRHRLKMFLEKKLYDRYTVIRYCLIKAGHSYVEDKPDAWSYISEFRGRLSPGLTHTDRQATQNSRNIRNLNYFKVKCPKNSLWRSASQTFLF